MGKVARSGPKTYSNTQLVAVSLLISLFVWMLAKQSEYDTDIISVDVHLEGVPPHLEAAHIPDTLDVSLQFPRALRGELLPSNFAIEIDASTINLEQYARRRGEASFPFFYPVKPADFRVLDPGLPADSFRMMRYDPETIQITAFYIGETTTIFPDWVGQPAAGYHHNREASRVLPRELFLVGPPNRIDKLRDPASGAYRVMTRPIELQGIRQTTVVNAELVLPEGVRPLDSEQRFVEVTVAIDEERGTRLLEGVPIRIPTITRLEPAVVPGLANVEVEGPQSALRQLDAEQIGFRLGSVIEETPGAVYVDVPIEAFIVPPKGSSLEDRRKDFRVIHVDPARVRVTYPAPAPTAP